MSWNCQQLEERINGYLESKMAALELQAADEHARTCPHCQEWYEARQVRALLLELEELETPPGLETRILAHTLAPPESESIWDMFEHLWRAFLQPRVAMSVGAAAFSLVLIFTTLDVRVTELEAADLNPVNIYRAVDSNAQLTYARGVRFFNELRVVYEIRNQLAELQGDTEESDSTESEDLTEESNPDQLQNQQPRKFLQGKTSQWSIAFSTLAVTRTQP
jgi:hypothetical protein